MNDSFTHIPKDPDRSIISTKKNRPNYKTALFPDNASKYHSFIQSILSKISWNEDLHNKLHFLELNSDTDDTADIVESSECQSDSLPSIPRFFSELDALLIFICLFLGILSRTFTTDCPNTCTFDETHFGNFTNAYIRQEYFVDIHPPLAKLWMAAFTKLQNYTGSTNYNSTTYLDTDYVELRFAVTAFSSLVPCLAYVSLRILGVSHANSFLAAILLLCDNSIAAEGKLILTDGILHSVSLISVCCTCYLLVDDSLLNLIICGVSVGAACSIKYTAGGLMFLPAFFLFFKTCGGNFFELFRLPPSKRNQTRHDNRYASDSSDNSEENENQEESFIMRFFQTKFAILIFKGIILGASAVSVLILSFLIHIIVCKYKSYLENGFDSSYENSLLWRWESKDQSRFVSMGLLKRAWTSFVSMYNINNRCKSLGGFESKWYQWPLVKFNSLIYFQTSHRVVWPLPNPFTYYFAVYGMILCLILPVFNLQKISLLSWAIVYSASLFPFILVPRTTYQYHYAIPLMIGVIGFCHAFSSIPMSNPIKDAFCYTLCVITLIFGIYYFPVLHSMPEIALHFRAWKGNLRRIYNQKFTMLSDAVVNIQQGTNT